MSKTNFINFAAKIARQGPQPTKVGAVIVSGGRVIAAGQNQRRYTRHTKNRRGEEGICAELSAVLVLFKKRRLDELQGSTMYVARVTKRNILALAKPCRLCELHLRGGGVRKVFYTDNNEIKELRL